MSSQLSAKLAAQAARDLLASVTNPDRRWGRDTAANCLPAGWTLAYECTESDFFPLTVKHAAEVFRFYARPRITSTEAGQ